MKYLGNEVQHAPDKFNLMVASHNEASVRKAVNLLNSFQVTIPEGSFVFGQVYGMAENISVPLGL